MVISEVNEKILKGNFQKSTANFFMVNFIDFDYVINPTRDLL